MAINRDLEPNELISLISVCQSEWTKRDQLLWQHAMQLFFASIFVMFVPHITNLIDNSSLPFQNWMFYLAGIAVAFVSLIIMLAAQRRIKVAGDIMRKLYKEFPPKYQRPEILLDKKDASKWGKPFIPIANRIIKWHLNKALLITMFGSIIIVGILLIVA